MAGDPTSKNPSSMEAANKSPPLPTPTLSRSAQSRQRRRTLSDGLASCDVASSSGVGICPVIGNRSGKELASSSTDSPHRISNEISDNASSKQVVSLPTLDDPLFGAIKGDTPGRSSSPSGLDSTPSRDGLSSSGRDVEFPTIYRRDAIITRNSKGKVMPASSTGSHSRTAIIRKRPAEVEDRGVYKSCSVPIRKHRKQSSIEVGDRAISKSCTLPIKRKRRHRSPDIGEANESFQEFIRQQKSYFAEIDAFKLPEEEASNDESE